MNHDQRSTAQWEAELGQRLRAARKRNGWSQQVLADRANVSLSAIKGLEAGHGSNLSTFVSAARALDLVAGLERMFATAATVSPVDMLAAQTAKKGSH